MKSILTSYGFFPALDANGREPRKHRLQAFTGGFMKAEVVWTITPPTPEEWERQIRAHTRRNKDIFRQRIAAGKPAREQVSELWSVRRKWIEALSGDFSQRVDKAIHNALTELMKEIGMLIDFDLQIVSSSQTVPMPSEQGRRVSTRFSLEHGRPSRTVVAQRGRNKGQTDGRKRKPVPSKLSKLKCHADLIRGIADTYEKQDRREPVLKRDVARALGINDTTLRRWLKVTGRDWDQLVNQALRNRAREK